MPTIVFASSKGGAGKTTAAIVLAGELAATLKKKNQTLALIDADPNQHSARWANKDGCPDNIKLYGNAGEENILDFIAEAEKESGFVVIDLEGTTNLSVGYAVSQADLVVIPCQGSQDDAIEALKTIKLIDNHRKVAKRHIPYSILLTRTSVAIKPFNLRHVVGEFKRRNIDMFNCQLVEKEAYKSIRSYGGLVRDLNPKHVGGIKNTQENVSAFVKETIKKIRQNQ